MVWTKGVWLSHPYLWLTQEEIQQLMCSNLFCPTPPSLSPFLFYGPVLLSLISCLPFPCWGDRVVSADWEVCQSSLMGTVRVGVDEKMEYFTANDINSLIFCFQTAGNQAINILCCFHYFSKCSNFEHWLLKSPAGI